MKRHYRNVPDIAAAFTCSHATVTVQLIEAGALSTALSIPVAASVSGVYTTNGRGWGQAAILNEDGSANPATIPKDREKDATPQG